ncbi:LPS export ABC transporter periplasmic protein LptC [Ideonella sp. DXS29W]|uniref:LPS export ABC transporter periplasmic protein LptC n=1 Tax=Ideonella lacteola TaxID=2984193 RepID=A0ABU9BR47_9BURK
MTPPKLSAELHLPDLPEVPVAIGAPAQPVLEPNERVRRQQQAWSYRLRHLFGTSLPLLMMALLAGLTWWLARVSPGPAGERPPAAERQDPDYTAQKVALQRFNPEGRLVAQIEGEQVRHYPATDELEVDTVRVSTTGADGRRTLATARQAVAAGDNSRYSLEGGARVVSTGADGHVVEIEGEHLLMLAKERRVRADRPVTVRQGGSALMADGMEFDEATQQVTLRGRVRGLLLPTDLKAAKP